MAFLETLFNVVSSFLWDWGVVNDDYRLGFGQGIHTQLIQAADVHPGGESRAGL